MDQRAAHYVNTGAPFDREDGNRVDRGDVIEPSEKELARYAYKLRPYTGDAATAPKPKRAPPRHQEPSAPGKWGADWPLQMDPELYQQLHPEGQHAALAKSILDRVESIVVEEEEAEGASD